MQFIDLKKQYEVLKEQIDNNIARVLDKGAYISGGEISELESELADYVGAKHCLCCANGTDALTIALRCYDVKAGDAVFVPSFTFFATAEVVALEHATPIFVDVDSRTFNMDAVSLDNAIKAVISQGKLNIKAIITVDLFGLPADYKAIRSVAKKYNLPIIEDSAQGFGGSVDGKMNCSFGDISTTSFFPAKPLGCYGDGGAIFTDNDEFYTLMKSLAVHGKGADKYDNVRIGYNSRLDTLQAAILLPKLKAFRDYELTDRNIIASKYDKALRAKYITPLIPSGYISSYAQYTLILESEAERVALQAKLKALNIPTMVYYPIPMHRETAFAGVEQYVDLSVSERLSKTVMSIPMHPYLQEDIMSEIISALLEK